MCEGLFYFSFIDFFFFFQFLAVLYSLWDFSSPSRDQTQILGSEGMES